jgi:D-lactate dehydrogenase (cytochrome)
MIIKTDIDTIEPYLTDASNMPGGMAEEVIIPETQDELREAIIRCAAIGKGITLAGTGTGLAGGRVPFGGAVISTERLNRIVSIDAASKRGIVEPGVVLRDYQTAVDEAGMLYPPDPTERGAAMSGTVACNSSGARTFKYGATRAFVERLRIFLADGEELNLCRGDVLADGLNLTLTATSGKQYCLALPDIQMPNIKHAAGYFVKPNMDAIDLFIGSEGTLGAIAEIETRLLPQPERIIAGVIFFDDIERLMHFVDEARNASLAANASNDEASISSRALEFFDSNALNFVRDKYPTIPEQAAGAIWFEQEVTDASEEALLTAWHELIGAYTPFMDESWFAITEKDQENLREFRHAVPAKTYEMIRELKQQKIGTDMAVPSEHFRDFYGFYMKEFAAEQLRYIVYGHIGNSHVHANIFTSSPDEYARAKAVYNKCVEKALYLGGTVSAEHGVGKIKAAYLRQMYGERGIEQFRILKAVLDPQGLFGKGTMF